MFKLLSGTLCFGTFSMSIIGITIQNSFWPDFHFTKNNPINLTDPIDLPREDLTKRTESLFFKIFF